ncbi:hypothetical protein L207DRAFT_516078 [Hyaloscypha variabilis F]|uniref:Uncharacterized protein n=1 Tax=Hyaloscypha variabilis (strain UAMH 11265 / GT02V1 / F) TaxID=1149755 RepID=A0A2J6R9G9_HYAVF|nr:hypothetical protein L207DRAFT_516078 [Hyaloscypha variabilis F]
MTWERIFQLCPESPNQGFLIALAPNQTLYREARYEWLKSAYITIRNPLSLRQRSVEELKLLKQVHIIWEQRWMYYFRGYFMLKNGTRTSIKTIFIDCQSISPDSSFYLLRIAATSALLRKVTIRLAPQCRSSCNWGSYRAQKHEIIERINEALGTSARIEHDATDDAEFLIWEAESNKVLIVKNRA